MDPPASGEITKNQVAPIFKVISELEDPYFSNTSLRTDEWQPCCSDATDDVSIVFIENIDCFSARGGTNGIVTEDVQVERNRKEKRRKKKIINMDQRMLNQSMMIGDEIPLPKMKKKTYTANFSMRKSPLYSKPKKGEIKLLPNRDFQISHVEEPLYEVPKDLLDVKPKKMKSRHAKTKSSSAISEDDSVEASEQEQSRIKKLKKKLSAKYEDLISKLLDKCEENELKLKEKNIQIEKLSQKLKLLHDYNNQFGDENDQLRQQREELAVVLLNYRSELEKLQVHLDNKAEKEVVTEEAIRMEMHKDCTNCMRREESFATLSRANSKLNQDVVMLKNVVYRLNVQLSRYQEKLRDTQLSTSQTDQAKSQRNVRTNIGDNPQQGDMPSMPSLPIVSRGAYLNYDDGEMDTPTPYSDDAYHIDNLNIQNTAQETTIKTFPKRDISWGDVNSHTLAPLLNAYQDSAAEREQLIQDYEKSFNHFTLKLKEVVSENNSAHDQLETLIQRANTAEDRVKSLYKERDELSVENNQMRERLELVEGKLMEMREATDQKVAVMVRDYDMLHREYFESKTKLAAIDAHTEHINKRDRDREEEYERKIAECKGLFEDLKRKYTDEKGTLEKKIADMESDKMAASEKMTHGMAEIERLHFDLNKIKKELRLSKRVCNVLRVRLSATKSTIESYKRRWKRTRTTIKNLKASKPKILETSPTRREVYLANTLEKIREEMKVVQKSAYKQLEAVDRRIRDQERYIANLQAKHASEIQKAKILVEQKELMIENLLDKMSGYENVTESRARNPDRNVSHDATPSRHTSTANMDNLLNRPSYNLHKDREKIMRRGQFINK